MVQEPVQQADGGGVFGQEAAPVLEGPVRGDRQRPTFVGGGHEAEQQLGAGVVQWGEAHFVELCRRRHRLTYADRGIMPTRRHDDVRMPW